jgi:hypothetical protein
VVTGGSAPRSATGICVVGRVCTALEGCVQMICVCRCPFLVTPLRWVANIECLLFRSGAEGRGEQGYLRRNSGVMIVRKFRLRRRRTKANSHTIIVSEVPYAGSWQCGPSVQ